MDPITRISVHGTFCLLSSTSHCVFHSHNRPVKVRGYGSTPPTSNVMWSSRNPYPFSYTTSWLTRPPRELPPPKRAVSRGTTALTPMQRLSPVVPPNPTIPVFPHVHCTALGYYPVPYIPLAPSPLPECVNPRCPSSDA